MKRTLTSLAVILMATTLTLAQMGSGTCDGTGPHGQGGSQGGQSGLNGTANPGSGNGTGLFDLNTLTTVTGEVVDFYSLQANACTPHNPVLLLDDGTTIIVATAPAWYLDAQQITFALGDILTVTGSLVNQGTEPVLIASQIVSGDATLILRDELGYPVWRATRSSQDGYRNPGTYQNLLYDTANETEIWGTVTDVRVGSMTPGTYPGYQLTVELEDGTQIYVRLAPYWYLLNQGFDLEEGTAVAIVGCTITLADGTEVFLARTVTYDDTTLVLRDEDGFPLFAGIRGPKNS